MDNRSKLLKRPTMSSSNSSAYSNTGSSSVEYSVCEIANELMNARTAFHKLHLKVTGVGSFASHNALNELYDALPGFADNLVEQYQGAEEKILTIPDCCPRTLNSKEEGLQYIRDLKTMVMKLQGVMPHSEIVNDLDLIKSTLNSIKYKLLFLS